MSYFAKYYGMLVLVLLVFALSGIGIVATSLAWWVYCIVEVALPILGLLLIIDAFKARKNTIAKILTGVFSVFGCWLINKAISFSEVFIKHTNGTTSLQYQSAWSFVLPVIMAGGIMTVCIKLIYDTNHALIPVFILTIVFPFLLCVRAYFVRFNSVKNDSDQIEACVLEDIDKLEIPLVLSRKSLLAFNADIWTLEIPVHLDSGETVYLTHPIEDPSSTITIYSDRGLFGRVSADTVKAK